MHSLAFELRSRGIEWPKVEVLLCAIPIPVKGSHLSVCVLVDSESEQFVFRER